MVQLRAFFSADFCLCETPFRVKSAQQELSLSLWFPGDLNEIFEKILDHLRLTEHFQLKAKVGALNRNGFSQKKSA